MFEHCSNCPIDFLFAERGVLLTVLLKQMWSLVRTKEMGVKMSDPYCHVKHLSLVKHHWISCSLFLSVGIKLLKRVLKFLDKHSHKVYKYIQYALCQICVVFLGHIDLKGKGQIYFLQHQEIKYAINGISMFSDKL